MDPRGVVVRVELLVLAVGEDGRRGVILAVFGHLAVVRGAVVAEGDSLA